MLHQHAPPLTSFAYSFTRNTDDADDLLQYIIKAISYFSRLKVGTDLKPWLFRIMRNTFINKYSWTLRKNNHYHRRGGERV